MQLGNMVIITRIVGGLGNQMFQYAVGRALSIEKNQTLKLDLTEMDRYKLRSFQLDQFGIHCDVADEKEIPFRLRKSFFGKIITSFKNAGRVAQVIEKSISFDPAILQLRGSVHLSGYWQSEKYFTVHADAIRQDFSLKRPFSGEREGSFSQIRNAEIAVSVHVRRGDYVTNPTANLTHGTCEPEWYRAAMERMVEHTGPVTFFVFSDDPQWARNNLPSFDRMVFVEPQSDGRDGEDMHLMARCHSHIIANSTFSWWGAWLNPRQDKHVIAPARWFRSEAHNASDLVPVQWERV